jgi:hypothetical protein
MEELLGAFLQHIIASISKTKKNMSKCILHPAAVRSYGDETFWPKYQADPVYALNIM